MTRRKRILDAADLIPREDVRAAIGATLRAERQMTPTTKATFGDMLKAKGSGFVMPATTGTLTTPVSAPCGCHACRDARETPREQLLRAMVLCPDCGNKRCPKASDHRHTCTGSNDPGQAGSIYA